MSRSRKPEAYLDSAARCCLFAGLTQKDISVLLTREGITVQHFARGETIYAPDGFLRSLGIILSGTASVRKREGNAAMLMSILTADDIFGAATLFSGEISYVATITAEQSTWALLIGEAVFRQMMRDNFSVAENYMSYLTKRIRFLSGRIDGFVRPGCEERVLRFLQRNRSTDCFPNMSIMAETLGISRASLYRVLDALEERGKIKRNGRQILLAEGDVL